MDFQAIAQSRLAQEGKDREAKIEHMFKQLLDEMKELRAELAKLKKQKVEV